MAIADLTDLYRDWDVDLVTGVADGGPVASLPDASANGVPATQATAGQQPLLAAAAVNGHAAIVLDGTTSNRYLTDASYLFNWAGSRTWHMVSKPVLGVPGVVLGGQRAYPSSLVFGILGYGDSGIMQAKGGTVPIAESEVATTEAWHIYTVTMVGAGGSSQLTVYQDGVQVAAGTGGNAAGDFPGIRIGAEFSQTAGQWYDPYAGSIARVVACSTAHDTATLNAAISELGSTYGITVSEIGGGGGDTLGPGLWAATTDGWKALTRTAL